MCGIVGVLSKNEVAPLLIDALKRLEYRGYDSAGIATINEGKMERRRAVGKLIELSDLLAHQPLIGKSGIGHTRWATHGRPSLVNAHPHRVGRVSVVHNGIIENYKALRAELLDNGHASHTETDTETVAMLTEYELSKGNSPLNAVRNCLAKIKGAFALCFIFEAEDNLMIATRKGSPLAIGYGDGEMFVGSDAIALYPLTDRICYMEDGDLALITRENALIENAKGHSVNREIHSMKSDARRCEKEGYRHFMEKEIHQQPIVLADTLKHYINPNGSIELGDTGLDFSSVRRVILIACGTAFYACLTAKYWFEKIARIPVEVDIASEFRYREPPIEKSTLAIFVSQSGETADTLAALRYCRGKTKAIWAVTNVSESSIAREADLNFPIYAGIEIGVASTKAFTCQLTVLLAIVVHAGCIRNTVGPDETRSFIDAMKSIPSLVSRALAQHQKIRNAANSLSQASDVLFLGRGLMFPLALEGALKLKEISYIHAEAYAAGELKHGPIALIDKKVPVVVIAPKDSLFDKTLSNMQEVLARNGRILMVTDKEGLSAADEKQLWQSIEMPGCPEVINPIVYAIPAQMLAYFTALAKGTDVDQPRNLAKSVTVE
ncbi:MAG: glutamine--fructose-6-phosphate transaminase (isomerizing) [Rhodobacteraceae bacterium]|nr:glutamine--fructose-6-phosphate transaminase (isomerizing) [Paracoccaceae bacterium]